MDHGCALPGAGVLHSLWHLRNSITTFATPRFPLMLIEKLVALSLDPSRYGFTSTLWTGSCGRRGAGGRLRDPATQAANRRPARAADLARRHGPHHRRHRD